MSVPEDFSYFSYTLINLEHARGVSEANTVLH